MASILMLMARAWLAVTMVIYLVSVARHSVDCHPRRRVAKKWALIVAGAKDYKNYFSQSLACQAYHTLRRGGIPKDNIVHVSYDDVAHDKENPYPGNLVTDVGGPNVYEDCHIDYRGKDANVQVFLKVLSGDKEGVKRLTGKTGKVIQSGKRDHVFVYMVDHGAPGGIFFFPGMKPLFAEDLVNAVVDMKTFDQFHGMVFYVESCYAGSLFHDLLPDNIGVYAVTFSNSTEESYKCCYDKTRKAYVGSVSGNAWMNNADSSDRRKDTFMDQFNLETKMCNGSNTRRASHPKEFGDLKMRVKTLSEFMGGGDKNSPEQNKVKRNIVWERIGDTFVHSRTYYETDYDSKFSEFLLFPPADMVPIATIMRRLSDPTIAKKTHEDLMAELRELILLRKLADYLAGSIVFEALKFEVCQHMSELKILNDHQVVHNRTCYRSAFHQVNQECPAIHSHRFPYVRKIYQSLINLCNVCTYSGVVFRAISIATSLMDPCKKLMNVGKL